MGQGWAGRREETAAAFDAAPVAMALVDPETGQFLRANLALENLLGYSGAELERLSYRDITPAQDLPLDEEATRRLLAGNEIAGSVEKRLRHRDGRLIWVRVSASVVRRPEGTPWVGVATVEPLAQSQRVDPRLEWLALHDPLTGAANRALLRDRIEHELHACERDGGAVAVLFCDVDDFKAVNDTHGHGCGDAVLVAIARRLEAAVRGEDTVARLGGDEFVVVGHVADDAHAASLRDRATEALAQPLELTDGGPVRVGVSVGLEVARPGAGVDTVLQRADAQMYAVKHGRRHGEGPLILP